MILEISPLLESVKAIAPTLYFVGGVIIFSFVGLYLVINEKEHKKIHKNKKSLK